MVPGKSRFWENSADLRNELVYNVFIQIMKLLHVAYSNKIDKTDKLYKLRPLIDKLNKSFFQISNISNG